ncbi:Protein of unknown function [Paucidesulfovibrio gracilis DSM 16080]|uniref:DUF4238 domain-containing protein n=1 Tax=Paucidesulfovibrio gracilis DSM 16080 TaxID=1121449 RepID=A0A1T4Y4H6_9BACT|nr:DUF4238 domain-containing protein [Paucidesulfovibrio gracilis]SKA96707.1 Protein of unknown function [Paucidesulfovibrio gracilis DSM 16080]
MTNNPIRHHIVPQCYLGLFTNEDSKLNVYPKDSRPRFLAGPNNVAVRKHYYSFTNDLNEVDARIERTLSEIEGVTKPILEAIQRGDELSRQDKENMAVFLGIMTTRNPNFRDGVENFQKQVLEQFKDVNVDHNPRFQELVDNAPEAVVAAAGGKGQVAAFLKNSMEVVVTPEASLEFVHLGLEVSKRLSEMHWRFWVNHRKNQPFVTSDNPCYVTNKAVEKTAYGVGIGLEGSRFHFPVSPSVFLVADWSGDWIDYKDVEEKRQVSMMNARTIRYAESEVYSPLANDFIEALYRKNKEYTQELLVDQLGPYHMMRRKLVKKDQESK